METLQTRIIDGYIDYYFGENSIMKTVAMCESGYQQIDVSGKVIMGRTTPDLGIFQINKVHWKYAKSLGFDPFTIEGNVRYAKYLHDLNGLSDWEASRKGCWQKQVLAKL